MVFPWGPKENNPETIKSVREAADVRFCPGSSKEKHIKVKFRDTLEVSRDGTKNSCVFIARVKFI